MDWDDERFNRSELKDHLWNLGKKVDDRDMDELLERTTGNTRTGQEFGFKPIEIALGSMHQGTFLQGWSSRVDKEGVSPFQKKPLPSSFWIRFREEWFQIRAFCSHANLKGLRPYECRIPFRDIVQGGVQLRAQYPYHGDQGRVLVTLTIQPRRVPFYSHHLDEVLMMGREPIFERHATESDFFHSPETEDTAGVIRAVGDDPRLMIRPGLWLVHRLTFAITVRQYKLLWMCLILLRVQLETSILAAPSPSLPMPTWTSTLLEHLDFERRYLVEGLLSHGVVITPEVPQVLASLGKYRVDLQPRILEGLFRWPRSTSLNEDLRNIARRVPSSVKLNEHFVPVRRCLITPSRCLLNPPVLETSNSLLRARHDMLDRFIRVQFVDDDADFPVTGETLTIDRELDGTVGVFARMRRALEYGLQIAGRSYTFLTFGESQIRECGCWMIAESGDFNVRAILAWMGDLSKERNIAKHAARQGLALSTTRHLDETLRISRIHDIKRNGYTFTDGAGVASQELIDRAARLCGYQTSSAVQGRIGGIKGVWQAAAPDDRTQNIDDILVRRSQIKFESNHDSLGVVKVASFSRASFNRQAILLLESLGVSTDSLLEMFRAEKAEIEEMGPAFMRKHVAALSILSISDAAGGGLSNDCLQEDVMNVIKCRRLSDLKWKASFEIEKSAFCMGIPDETDSLDEGQIFCQLQPSNNSASVVAGHCIIYRNPCLHPGDIRPVIAVDSPQHRHLKNVIVFSTRGERDLPNMLAGGDLDGDCYSLIWDTRVQISEDSVHEPMDYSPPTPILSPYPVTVEQTKEHFVNFVRNDVLGRICNAHMAIADEHGPDDAQCVDLARMASRAVDFSKTGVPVPSQAIPIIDQYPDFMDKEHKQIRVFKKEPVKTYESQKVLGTMYREIPVPRFEAAEDLKGDPQLALLEEPQAWRGYLEQVAISKARYDFHLTGLLRRYKISEAECVAGVTLRSPKTRLRVERDFDLRVAVREAYQTVVTSAKTQALADLADNSLTGDPELDRRAWALSAYKLTHEPELSEYKPDWSEVDVGLMENEVDDLREEIAEQGLHETRLFSYPWLFATELIALKRSSAQL